MSNARLIPFEDLSLVTFLRIMHVRYQSDYAMNYLALERKRPMQTSETKGGRYGIIEGLWNTSKSSLFGSSISWILSKPLPYVRVIMAGESRVASDIGFEIEIRPMFYLTTLATAEVMSASPVCRNFVPQEFFYMPVLDMGIPCDSVDIKPIVQFVPHSAKCIYIDCNDGVDDSGA
ncbi:hypothetical protein ANN_24295 [Periplaneta americana]|uniref:Uncharacterized protein n=1 Tax=Periplaneta americana TaxID=6978 RepID=A0ABQ8S2P4_PERAM|nr:hypothetical protein ANN_24295 [Periplaneta americana]